MKKAFPLLFVLHTLLFGACQLHAQDTRMSYRLARLAHDESKSTLPVTVLVKGQINAIKEAVTLLGGQFRYAAGNIASVTLPAGSLFALSQNQGVQRMEEGSIRLTPMNEQMRINNRIDLVQNGVSPLPKGYDGEGVMVGIIDTGLDFMHPDFLDSLGQTRVWRIWDHLLPNAANTPAPYGYGQEFTKANMDAGQASATFDRSGHGTHVTGIAVSNGHSHTEYTGAAPKANIVAVSLDFNLGDDDWLSSIADAVDYIYSKADSLNQPCVINISAGTYYGSHDGQDLSAQMIDNLITAKNGRLLSAACGNAGGYPIHVRQAPQNDTLFTWFSSYQGQPVYIECWADTADAKLMQLSLGADVTVPSFEDRGQLNWIQMNQQNGQMIVDTLWSASGNKIAKVTRYSQLVGSTYSQIYYVEPDSISYLFRLMSKGTGAFDCWSFDMVDAGLPAPSAYPFITHYQLPDLNQNMCSSFQCSDKVITVGQYVNRNHYVDVNGNLQTFPTTEGDLAATSSWGPTRDGRIKPDITSTGEMTLSALRLSSVAWFLANQPFKLAPDSIHIRDGGTSSAAPVVAGLGALYLQKNPTGDWSDFRTRVRLCSKKDSFTGTSLPNNSWGYGKLDGFAVMAGCNAMGTSETKLNNITVSIYPNPANDLVTLSLPALNDQAVNIKIINAMGALVYAATHTIRANDLMIETADYPAGIYLIQIQTENSSIGTKLLISK